MNYDLTCSKYLLDYAVMTNNKMYEVGLACFIAGFGVALILCLVVNNLNNER